MIHAADFRKGMRRLASGVSIVTTAENGVPCGFVATAVTSVAAEPAPTLLICVSTGASSHDAIVRAGYFCVNLLDENNADMARLFSSAAHREQRFESTSWTTLATGAPALSNAIASFDCVVTNSIPVHTHTVFIATVVDLVLRDTEGLSPLLYADGKFDALRSAVARAGGTETQTHVA